METEAAQKLALELAEKHNESNPFRLRNDPGQETATDEIRAAIKNLVEVLKKHRNVGAYDTDSREAVTSVISYLLSP